jgi:hypothetical protein
MVMEGLYRSVFFSIVGILVWCVRLDLVACEFVDTCGVRVVGFCGALFTIRFRVD